MYCLFIAGAAQAAEPAPAGVGMLLTLDKPSHFVVQYVLPDMPAAKADVKVGDVVLAVNEVPVDNVKTVEELVDKIRGASGSTVKLKIQSGSKTRDIVLVRGTIPTVKSPATDDFRREVSVYFYQHEDLIPDEPGASAAGYRSGIVGDHTVRDFLRKQLTRRGEH
ncbi:MAG: PDZ domain-containing protein [Cyanobacteria bacterium SZAS-4]|nr:PDZ domain-containing protein [Cyanobacteria bacterium SZAS-4]